MAKVSIVGNAVVITSELKLEDIELLQKYRPTALVLKDEQTDEPVFKIGLMDGFGKISKYGAEFSTTTQNNDKKAIITAVFERETDDIKQEVMDGVGTYLITLNKLERNLLGIIDEVKAEKDRLAESISVIQ